MSQKEWDPTGVLFLLVLTMLPPVTPLCRREVATGMRRAVLKLSEVPKHELPPLHCEHQLVLAAAAEEEGLQSLLFNRESVPSAQAICSETSSTEP